MTFPVIQQSTTGVVGTAAAASTSVITLPSTINSGDMLLAIFTANGGTGSTITWNSSAVGTWTQLASNTQSTGFRSEIWYRFADGTEDGKNVTIDLDTARTSAWIVYRVSGISPVTPNITSADFAQSSTSTPNPPSLTPSWGQQDTLWLAVLSHGGLSGTITGVPANYSNNVASYGSGTTRVSIFSTDRSLNASTEDPGTYTRSSTGNSLALTIALRGVGVQVTSANATFYANESGVRLQGSGLAAVTNVLLTSGTRNVQTTVTSADSGNVYFTVPSVNTLVSSNIKFQSVTLTANDSGSVASISGSVLLPNVGYYAIHDVTDISQTPVPTCIYYGQTPSVQVGDQILYTNSNDVTIDSQGYPVLSNGRTSFSYQIFDTTDETWGAVGTYSTGSSPPASSNVAEWVFQSEQFVEVGKTNGISPATVMRMFANGTVQLGEMVEVAGTSSMRLFANGAVQAAEFIEV